MDQPTQSERVLIVLMGMAHSFSDDLTIIVSAAYEALIAMEPSELREGLLRDLEDAAARCQARTAALRMLGACATARSQER